MTNDATRATAETLPEINRRRFLLNTASVASAVAIVTPVNADEPEMTPYEQAIWHIRELERLIAEDGGSHPIILVQGKYGPSDYGALCLNSHGVMKMEGDIFRRNPAQMRGGAA